MAHNINELEKQIVEKNRLLKKISCEDNSTDEKVEQVQIELDALLFRYLKALKTSGVIPGTSLTER